MSHNINMYMVYGIWWGYYGGTPNIVKIDHLTCINEVLILIQPSLMGV